MGLGRIVGRAAYCQNDRSMSRTSFAFALALVVAGCLSSPTVQLVDQAPGDGGSPEALSGDASTEAAPPDVIDDACSDECAAAGGTCSAGTCVITCPGAASCANVVCPEGVPCQVECVGREACGKVTCTAATSCTIRCDGDHACKGDVRCSGPSCAVTCTNGGCKADDVKCCASTCTVDGAPGRC